MYRKCKYCNSEYVVWNWIFSKFWATWFRNFLYNSEFPYFRWKFWKFFDRYIGECWDCNTHTKTFFKVRNGIPYEKLQNEFIILPKHKLQDDIEEIWWIQDQSKYFTEKERHKFENRLNNLFNSIKENFNEQWELDNSIRTKSKPEDEKYKNHFHSASILKVLED